MKFMRLHQSGFTLVEMAMVLLIVGLLLGGLMPTISGQVERQRSSETGKQLDEIKEALIGYAVANKHLPCPAKSASDGTENRNAATGICNTRVGLLPWTELGVSKTDSWGRIFLYSASNNFTNSSPATVFNLTSTRDITIKTRDATGALVNLSNANDIPAVVLSTGANGIFGTIDSGIIISSAAPAGTHNVDDQKSNTDATGTTFVSREQAAAANSTDEAFDDLVTWISPNVLINRMVAARQLP